MSIFFIIIIVYAILKIFFFEVVTNIEKSIIDAIKKAAIELRKKRS